MALKSALNPIISANVVEHWRMALLHVTMFNGDTTQLNGALAKAEEYTKRSIQSAHVLPLHYCITAIKSYAISLNNLFDERMLRDLSLDRERANLLDSLASHIKNIIVIVPTTCPSTGRSSFSTVNSVIISPERVVAVHQLSELLNSAAFYTRQFNLEADNLNLARISKFFEQILTPRLLNILNFAQMLKEDGSLHRVETDMIFPLLSYLIILCQEGHVRAYHDTSMAEAALTMTQMLSTFTEDLFMDLSSG